MDEMRVDKSGGYPDLSWVSVRDLGWGHSGSALHSFSSASGFSSGELIPHPPLCTVLVGLSIRGPTPHPSVQVGGMWFTPSQQSLVVSRALNLGWRNLLELSHCSSSMQGRPSVLSTWTPRASSISVLHQAWFCTLPVDSLTSWIFFQKKSFCFDLAKMRICCLQKKNIN